MVLSFRLRLTSLPETNDCDRHNREYTTCSEYYKLTEFALAIEAEFVEGNPALSPISELSASRSNTLSQLSPGLSRTCVATMTRILHHTAAKLNMQLSLAGFALIGDECTDTCNTFRGFLWVLDERHETSISRGSKFS